MVAFGLLATCFFSIVFFLAILTISIQRDVGLGVFSWLVVSGGGGGGGG